MLIVRTYKISQTAEALQQHPNSDQPMKDSYSLSNDNDPIVANERLRNKLDYLERESIKRESYVKDLENSLKLNKESLRLLSKEPQKPNQALDLVVQQNKMLHRRLKEEYASICRLNAVYLMECQLRTEDSRFYNDRITDFQNSINELRRYLHDKEETFSCVVEKLKKYEQLGEASLFEKLKGKAYFTDFLKDETKTNIESLIKERDSFKRLYQQSAVTQEGFKKFSSFQLFQKCVHGLSTETLEKVFEQKVRNVSGQNESTKNSTFPSASTLEKNPDQELIRLMKKEHLNNQVLESALEDAIDKNLTLINYNKKLFAHIQKLQSERNQTVAQMTLLCEDLLTYDHNYRTKVLLIKQRSKCDADKPSHRSIIERYLRNDPQQVRKVMIQNLAGEVKEIGEFFDLLGEQQDSEYSYSNQNMWKRGIRSMESPRNRMMLDPNEDDQEQYSISQI